MLDFLKKIDDNRNAIMEYWMSDPMARKDARVATFEYCMALTQEAEAGRLRTAQDLLVTNYVYCYEPKFLYVDDRVVEWTPQNAVLKYLGYLGPTGGTHVVGSNGDDIPEIENLRYDVRSQIVAYVARLAKEQKVHPVELLKYDFGLTTQMGVSLPYFDVWATERGKDVRWTRGLRSGYDAKVYGEPIISTNIKVSRKVYQAVLDKKIKSNNISTLYKSSNWEPWAADPSIRYSKFVYDLDILEEYIKEQYWDGGVVDAIDSLRGSLPFKAFMFDWRFTGVESFYAKIFRTFLKQHTQLFDAFRADMGERAPLKGYKAFNWLAKLSRSDAGRQKIDFFLAEVASWITSVLESGDTYGSVYAQLSDKGGRQIATGLLNRVLKSVLQDVVHARRAVESFRHVKKTWASFLPIVSRGNYYSKWNL